MDYTTEGVADALIVCALRVQGCRGEVQDSTVDIRVDLSLPVVPADASAAQTTSTIVVVASAEEGERSYSI